MLLLCFLEWRVTSSRVMKSQEMLRLSWVVWVRIFRIFNSKSPAPSSFFGREIHRPSHIAASHTTKVQFDVILRIQLSKPCHNRHVCDNTGYHYFLPPPHDMKKMQIMIHLLWTTLDNKTKMWVSFEVCCQMWRLSGDRIAPAHTTTRSIRFNMTL